MIKTKEKIELAQCIACHRSFWVTEAYSTQVREGKEESLCCECSKPLGFDEGGEDDNSEQFDFVEPEPMEGLV